MNPNQHIANFIQAAMVPVFLLTAVASTLIVLTNRLARIVDRARALNERTDGDEARVARTHEELALLARRARLVNGAITLAVLSGLLVCVVIVLLFTDAAWHTDTSRAIALTFTIAMVCLIAALASFLRETYLATAALRFSRHR